MSQQAGWYDDPEDGAQLRYWDGVQWTDHVAPKQKPNLERAGRQLEADAAQRQGRDPQHEGWRQGQQGWAQGGSPPHGSGASGWGQQQAQQGQPNPWAAQAGQQSQGPGVYRQTPGPTTPDGQPLAGWWHRVGARLVDALLSFIVAVVLMAATVTPEVMTALEDFTFSGDPTAPLPVVLEDWYTQFLLTTVAAGLLYEILMVKFFGGTVGKLMTGLRIRLRERPGPLPWSAVLLRSAVFQVPNLISNLLPRLGFLGLFSLVDVLWPLWDQHRQAIHDKVARTNVVRVR